MSLWSFVHWGDKEGHGDVPQGCHQKRGDEKSANAEHVWTNNHSPLWNEITVLDQARDSSGLLIKEAFTSCLQIAQPTEQGSGSSCCRPLETSSETW